MKSRTRNKCLQDRGMINNIFNAVSGTPEQASLDKKRSDLMIEIREKLESKTAPIKNTVQVLGVTPAQARNLVKGNIEKFTFYELQTFLNRLTTDMK